MKTEIKAAISAAIFLTALTVNAPAQAALITHSFVVDPDDLLVTEFSVLGIRIRETAPITGFTPFQIQAGDFLETTVSFTSPVGFQDFAQVTNAFANTERFSVTYRSPDPVVGTQEVVRTTSVSILGAAGDFLGNPPPFTNGTSSTTVSFINQTDFGNLTDSFMTFTGFVITTEIHSITSNVNTYDSVTIGILDEFIVPAPGALALLGFGLIGLGLRRKAA